MAFIDLWNSSAKPGRKMFFRVTRRGEEESGGRIMYGWRHCRASRFGDKCSEENGGIGVVIGFMEKRCDNLVPIEDFSGYFTRCISLLFKIISFHSVALYISLKSIFF